MDLRPYQRDAIDAVLAYWAEGGGNPVVEAATGTGKSVIIATLARELIERWPRLRILMVVHVRELVAQNAQALLRAWPGAPLGVNSAGLGRRDRRSQILYASIQSVFRDRNLGEYDLVIVDEAHLVPRDGEGMYLTLIERLREQRPDLRICGFTATPYRMDAGLIHGDGAIFDDLAFSYGIDRGVADGYLSPLVSRAGRAEIDVSGVAKRGGEFIAGSLESAALSPEVTAKACEDLIARGADRRSWLCFCAGVKHAEMVRDALLARGVNAATVTGETPTHERDRHIRDFRDGRLRCLTNANVLTTGFDAPATDLIAMLRPTLSTGLYVQMLGRGTRIAPGKSNCLVLDFAGNVRRHGPVDAISVDHRGPGAAKTTVETVRAKVCPECDALVSVNTRICDECGYHFPVAERKGHAAKADDDAPVMARDLESRWLAVDIVSLNRHDKPGSPPSIRVEYLCGFQAYREWVTLEHAGFAQAKAHAWWRAVMGGKPPATVAEALAYGYVAPKIEAITVKRDGKYWTVTGRRARTPDGALVEINERMRVKIIEPKAEAA